MEDIVEAEEDELMPDMLERPESQLAVDKTRWFSLLPVDVFLLVIKFVKSKIQ